MSETKKQIVQRYHHASPSLLELSHGETVEALEWDKTHLAESDRRSDLGLIPNINEVEVVRHYTKLSQKNFGLDEGMYPLGSCTMKYNPKINETVAGIPGLKWLHPKQPAHQTQGALELLYELQESLVAVTGLDDVTLQPAAGAQGEFVGLKVIDAYHRHNKQKRHKVLIPESAHGTNPASSSLCGMEVVSLEANAQGIITRDEVMKHMDESVAALMITIPNTLGVFESDIVEIASIIHDKGGFIYCDGANLNALMCRVDFKKMGVDIMHMNLHKTFSTPHGGGGPGAGPVAAVAKLSPYLPTPTVVRHDAGFRWQDRGELSIGRVKPFHGSFGILMRALAYIMTHGGHGLKKVSDIAVLNNNYLRANLSESYEVSYDSPSLHETVFTDKHQRAHGVTTLDIAKRLMDYGFHPPTVYFPLIVKNAIMVEPTETVSRVEMDRFVAAMRNIDQEAKHEPDTVCSAPHETGVARFDEAKAARKPVLTWNNKRSET